MPPANVTEPNAKQARAENGIELDVQNAFSQQDAARERAPLYVVVEKILEPGEHLPSRLAGGWHGWLRLC